MTENQPETVAPQAAPEPAPKHGGESQVVSLDPEAGAMRAGKRSFDVAHEYRSHDYLKRGENISQFRPKQGLHTTKFHNGFMRRQNGPASHKLTSEQEIQREAVRARRRDYRRDELTRIRKIGMGNGLLTGDYNGTVVNPAPRPRGRRHFNQVLSNTSIIEGEIKLRQSHHRFYSELPDQVRQDRSRKIREEGLTAPRMSSVLGIGRSDTGSFGASDNFSNSLYLSRMRAQNGSAQPGHTLRGAGTSIIGRKSAAQPHAGTPVAAAQQRAQSIGQVRQSAQGRAADIQAVSELSSR